MVLLVSLDDNRDAVVKSENGAISSRAERPLPSVVVIIAAFARRHHPGSVKDRVQRDVYDFGGAGSEGDILANGGKK